MKEDMSNSRSQCEVCIRYGSTGKKTETLVSSPVKKEDEDRSRGGWGKRHEAF
jgi:hypothetical protein